MMVKVGSADTIRPLVINQRRLTFNLKILNGFLLIFLKSVSLITPISNNKSLFICNEFLCVYWKITYQIIKKLGDIKIKILWTSTFREDVWTFATNFNHFCPLIERSEETPILDSGGIQSVNEDRDDCASEADSVDEYLQELDAENSHENEELQDPLVESDSHEMNPEGVCTVLNNQPRLVLGMH